MIQMGVYKEVVIDRQSMKNDVWIVLQELKATEWTIASRPSNILKLIQAELIQQQKKNTLNILVHAYVPLKLGYIRVGRS